jgi:MFS family permease
MVVARQFNLSLVPSSWLLPLLVEYSLRSLLAGRLTDSLGRCRLGAGYAFLYAFAAANLALSISAEWNLILALRFLSGMAIGGFDGKLRPMFVKTAEIAVK